MFDLTSLFRITYGLYIASSSFGDVDTGCIINTLQQVTNEPPKLSVTISKENLTEEIIRKSGRFTASVLDESSDFKFIGKFGFKSGRDIDKFADTEHHFTPDGIPYVTEHTTAWYSCKVIEVHDLGTHSTFIGEILDGATISDINPLTYTYYRDVIKGATPKNAPSYQKK